jgi:hypothetical protein
MVDSDAIGELDGVSQSGAPTVRSRLQQVMERAEVMGNLTIRSHGVRGGRRQVCYDELIGGSTMPSGVGSRQ